MPDEDKNTTNPNEELRHPFNSRRGIKRLLEAKEFATSLKSLFKVGKIVPMYKGIPNDKEISKKDLGKVSIILSEEE